MTMTAARGPKLTIDPEVVREARRLASQAGEPIVAMARSHTTVSVERAVLRLAGLSGADPDGMPLVNKLVDAVRDQIGLETGVALPAWDALISGGYADLAPLASDAAAGKVSFRVPAGADAASAQQLYDDFKAFVAANRPDDLSGPTQAPGVIGI